MHKMSICESIIHVIEGHDHMYAHEHNHDHSHDLCHEGHDHHHYGEGLAHTHRLKQALEGGSYVFGATG